MASRFTFTEKQYNEIKALMAPGPKHKSYRQIGEKYDIGKSTLNRINQSTDFHDYRRKSLIRSANRRVRRNQRQATHQLAVSILAAIAVIEFFVILTMAGAF